jgi:SAM-dependent methyltransferase
LTDAYGLPSQYIARTQPEYFQDTSEEVVWQPDLYEDAADLADELGVLKIFDLGCGSGIKLKPLFERFSVVGVDYGPNLEKCRALG